MNEQELLQAIRSIVKEEVAPINDRLSRVESTLENRVLPAIQLLAEGQQNILEHIEEKVTSKYEELDDRVTALEAAYRELKRAQ